MFGGVLVGFSISIAGAIFRRTPLKQTIQSAFITSAMFSVILGFGSTMRGC